MPTTPIYKLPKGLAKQVLLDCYNALLDDGKTKDYAKRKVSNEIIFARLIDLENMIDISKYRL